MLETIGAFAHCHWKLQIFHLWSIKASSRTSIGAQCPRWPATWSGQMALGNAVCLHSYLLETLRRFWVSCGLPHSPMFPGPDKSLLAVSRVWLFELIFGSFCLEWLQAVPMRGAQRSANRDGTVWIPELQYSPWFLWQFPEIQFQD